MGDIPMEPLSLLVVDAASSPALSTPIPTGRPIRSAEHGNVVPDVPPTL